MRKLVFIFTALFLISFSAKSQTANKFNGKTFGKLLDIAKEYVKENPDDSKATSLLERTIQIKSEYTLLLDKSTNGIYSKSDLLEKVKLEKEANSTDEKAKALSGAFKSSFKACNEYFQSVSVSYKIFLEESQLKMKKMKEAKKSKKKGKKN